MPFQRIGFLANRAKAIPRGPQVAVLLEALAHRLSLARAQELERVPRRRVVARREDDAARGLQLLDRELRGGRGGEADVHDVTTGGVDARACREPDHGPGHARIAADDAGP